MKTRNYIRGQPWSHGKSHLNHVGGRTFFQVGGTPAFKKNKGRVTLVRRERGR